MINVNQILGVLLGQIIRCTLGRARSNQQGLLGEVSEPVSEKMPRSSDLSQPHAPSDVFPRKIIRPKVVDDGGWLVAYA